MWWSLLGCVERVEPTVLAGPSIRFDLSTPAALFDAPFPSDHRPSTAVYDWPDPGEVPWFGLLVELASGRDGFGTTSGVLFGFEEAVDLVPVDAWRSVEPSSPAFLVALDGPDQGLRVPVDASLQSDGGPYGASNLLTLLPLQGVPLRPETTWAAVLTTALGDGAPLAPPAALLALRQGQTPPGVSPATAGRYVDALDALADLGTPRESVAGLAVFRTGDPTAEFHAFVAHAAGLPSTPLAQPDYVEAFDGYCVFETLTTLPDYQAGTPPFLNEGGGWARDDDGVPVVQREASARVFATIPKGPAPAGGFPVVVFVRTGAGGDRPLVDRGVRGADGAVVEAGSGLAREFAEAGFVGLQVDGPHGGPYRNPGGADEQFLMFNVANPLATRDNVRQSALELALLPALLASWTFDGSACAGGPATVTLDPDTLALFGHSMGATIAPLAAAGSADYGAVLLSGAGGSYIANLVYKQSPLEIRPIAEALLGYSTIGRPLTEFDPVLQLLQWASEPADPPVYAAQSEAHVLMMQGIVDTYNLPPMANATSLSTGLDLGGAALDATHPDLADLRSLEPLLPLVGRVAAALPLVGNNDGRTRVVVQHPEDGIEDGHEVVFQTSAPKQQLVRFLETFATGTPEVPAVPGGG